ncbi:MAG: nucleotidyltransferase domain-containing protein [Methylophilaceae bacterium]
MKKIANQEPTQINSWELMLLEASARLSLTPAQYEKICERYAILQRILDAASEPILQGAHIFVQGSIGTKTAIRPVNGAEGDMSTVDADAIVLLPNAGSATAIEVLEAIQARFEAGSRVEHPVKPLRRGIRIVYADENPGFHMDITPARKRAGNTENEGYGPLEVPDRDLKAWKNSSPRSYSNWLEAISAMSISVVMDEAAASQYHRKYAEFAEATQDPLPEYDSYAESNPLRVTIKLLKRHRDEWAIRTKRTDFRPISAVITTLACLAYEEVVNESQFKRIRPIEATFLIIEKMVKFIKYDGTTYSVRNPKDSGENFAEKWNRADGFNYIKAFNDWHIAACAAFELGFQELESTAKLEVAMTEAFGLPAKHIQELIKSMPGTWTLPGQKAGVSLNKLSSSALFGSGFNSQKAQDKVGTAGRFG